MMLANTDIMLTTTLHYICESPTELCTKYWYEIHLYSLLQFPKENIVLSWLPWIPKSVMYGMDQGEGIVLLWRCSMLILLSPSYFVCERHRNMFMFCNYNVVYTCMSKLTIFCLDVRDSWMLPLDKLHKHILSFKPGSNLIITCPN